MKLVADIDIDVVDRKGVIVKMPCIPAMMISRDKYESHNTGVYLQAIPTLENGLAAFDYKTAEDLGYFKLDFINNSLYSGVRNMDHLKTLMSQDPPWELFDSQEIVGMLAHVHDHYDVVSVVKPRSLADLAIVLALIRPGKRHLLYRPKDEILASIWEKPQDGSYYFKKAHAFAFASSIVVQLNLLIENA